MPVVNGTWVFLPVSERDGGGVDLNGDGDTTDYVAHLYDRVQGVLNLGLATPVELTEFIAVAWSDGFGFLVYEDGEGRDLNGDGDTNDLVAHVYETATGVTNVSVAVDSMYPHAALIALSVSEDSQGGTDLNGDGDTQDRVLHMFSAAGGLVNTGEATCLDEAVVPFADGFAFGAGSLSGPFPPPCNLHLYDPTTGVSDLGTRMLPGREKLVVGAGGLGFLVAEDGADLNGDGDMVDSVAHAYNSTTGITNLGLAGSVAAGGSTIVLGVTEWRQGNVDLNGDGDASDDVIHVYEPVAGVSNLGVEGLEVAPMSNGFGFMTYEGRQGDTDLNGDGDTDDFVAHLYTASTGVMNLGLAIGTLSPYGPPWVWSGENWVAIAVSEAFHGGVDLNGDGDSGDLVPHVANPSGSVTNLMVAARAGTRPLAEFGDGFVFVGPEQFDSNGDGDTSDDVAHLYAPASGVLNLGIPADSDSLAASPDLAVVGVSEWAHGAADLNGDGDTGDLVAHAVMPDIFPVAEDDLYLVTSGGVVDEPGPGVLGNDSDPQGDAITVISYTDPSEGTLEIYTDGSFTYTHNGTDTTVDTFTYWAGDGTDLSNEATVWITINDPPIAVDDGPYSVDVAGTLVETPPGLLANDSDPDGDPVVYHSYGDPAHGTLTVFVDGAFIYTHDGSNTTSDSFSYWATDGIWLSNEATVSLTINPVIDLELSKNVAPAQVSVGEQTTFTVSVTNQGPSDATGVTVRDSLPAALTYVADNGGGSFDPATGVWTVGDLEVGATATLELVVAVDQAGTFVNVAEVAAADQPDVDSTPNNNDPAEDDLDNAAVTAVEPPNQAPIAADDGPYTVAQGDTLTVNGVLDNDSDADGDALIAVKSADPAHGTLTLNPNGSFVYVHDGTATTTDSFKYRANDGEDDSNIATVSITITPVQVLPGTLEATSVGLVDPSQGKWYLRDYDTGTVNSFFYGNPGDVPFMGDWDCNGEATPGLFRQSDAYAYLRNSNTVGIADIRFYFGNPDDVPLAGDFDGDGCDSLSIYRPSEQRFYIMNELGENEGGLGAAEFFFTFGNPGDKPVVGDWDGDGIDEVGLHRESTGFFYYRDTLNSGIADDQFYFGDPGDRFAAGDWGTIDGVETPAVFRPSNTTFYFRWTNTPGAADSEFVWGEADWLPVSGVLD